MTKLTLSYWSRRGSVMYRYGQNRMYHSGFCLNHRYGYSMVVWGHVPCVTFLSLTTACAR